MIISAAVTSVFLSPLLFVLAIAAGVLLIVFGRRRTGLAIVSAAGLVLYLTSIEPVHDALLLPLEDRYPALSLENLPPLDAIVVLGGGLVDSSPELGGRASPSQESLKRLIYGMQLFRRRGVPIFVSGGRVWKWHPEAEADVAGGTLLSLGVPPDAVRREAESKTTWENARDLAPMLASAGVVEVALVTSAYHMPRAALAFSRAGVKFVPAPTDYRARRVPYTAASLLPSFVTLGESFAALREYLGLVQYRLRR